MANITISQGKDVVIVRIKEINRPEREEHFGFFEEAIYMANRLAAAQPGSTISYASAFNLPSPADKH